MKTLVSRETILLVAVVMAACKHPSAPDVETVAITYKTSYHLMDVTYCREDGAIAAEYGVSMFEKTLEIPVGGKVCISARKLAERDNIDARVYIKSGDVVLYESRGAMEASISGHVGE